MKQIGEPLPLLAARVTYSKLSAVRVISSESQETQAILQQIQQPRSPRPQHEPVPVVVETVVPTRKGKPPPVEVEVEVTSPASASRAAPSGYKHHTEDEVCAPTDITEANVTLTPSKPPELILPNRDDVIGYMVLKDAQGHEVSEKQLIIWCLHQSGISDIPSTSKELDALQQAVRSVQLFIGTLILDGTLVELRPSTDSAPINRILAAYGYSKNGLDPLPENPGGSIAMPCQISVKDMPICKNPVVRPFSATACGLNLLLSRDGYTVQRGVGCRDSVAIGEAALQRQEQGLYFELRVEKVIDGWLGGLAVGVTHTPPSTFDNWTDGGGRHMPDLAWRVPDSFVVGYSGRAYMNGHEGDVGWRPDTLCEGQIVGCLVTGDGRANMLVLVDSVVVATVDGETLRAAGLRDEPLYPIVDVSNATQKVCLNSHAAAPLHIAPC